MADMEVDRVADMEVDMGDKVIVRLPHCFYRISKKTCNREQSYQTPNLQAQKHLFEAKILGCLFCDGCTICTHGCTFS